MTKSNTSILFVCMGNICRSPAAEGVMLHQLEKASLSDQVRIDSAGTFGFHAGNLPDKRMRAAASHRGITLESRAREIQPADLESFDLILVMDRDNLANVRALDPTQIHQEKIRLFCDYCTEHDQKEVPDPYYGGPDGFELVLDLLEDGCTELTRRLQAHQPLR
ncbi:low molecular weight phosphotyrosine protein phosphatase [Phragmitibacter flavus]|uniref:Low molecular weight phosphotyrosine protein phosphatase n=1 Tax=Phragmitibacter flavus TaxID=2576071 RepID=A0A5R8KBR1_9BACT|nr:low molecular weight protein-tyrosine-phosphatase [Phragmitibacter flavus]TLD68999.1 low molecular weight phosphotyrosine protein phosphatase [Phragmitibacter flavus]